MGLRKLAWREIAALDSVDRAKLFPSTSTHALFASPRLIHMPPTMTPTLSLIAATVADAPALSTLMTETFLAAYGHVAPEPSLREHIANSYGAARVAALLQQGSIEIWRLRDGTRDAGYIQLGLQVPTPPTLMGLRAFEVQRCYLHTEYIGGGGGTLLMDRAQQRTLELGADALFLSVYQLAPRAIRFYEKHGFRIAAPVVYHIADVPFNDWQMTWVREGVRAACGAPSRTP